MNRHRWRLMSRSAIVVVAVAAVAAATFVIGRWTAPLGTGIRAANAPAPTVTVTAEKRQITVQLQVTAIVRPAAEYQIPVVHPAGVARLVVTGVPTEVGAQVDAGDVVAEISGRPMIVLPGEAPSYREVTAGDVGRDVRQLQRALASLGYEPEQDGTFGPATGTAVTAFYDDRGYTALQGGDKGAVRVPAGELVFLPDLPVTVTSLPGKVGASAQDVSITAHSDAPGVVVAQMSAASSRQATPGTPVVLHCGGTEIHGTLGEAGQRAASMNKDDAAGGAPIDRAVTVTSPHPDLSVGTSCAGTATVEITQGKVLAVPASAVYDSSGSGTVIRLDNDGSDGDVTTVPVTIGRSGDGWLEIDDPPAPLHPGVSLIAGSGAS